MDRASASDLHSAGTLVPGRTWCSQHRSRAVWPCGADCSPDLNWSS